MTWHVLASSYFDFDKFRRASEADLRPIHLVPSVAESLGGQLHQPQPDSSNSRFIDRIGAVLYGQPENWAAARKLAKILNSGDAVYVTGDSGGVPLAILCALRRKRISLAIHFVDARRTRTKIFGWILVVLVRRLLVLVTLDQQRADALGTFGRRAQAVYAVKNQTDTNFFRPPEERAKNAQPTLSSCGVEQRDYATFAQAVEGLALDVIPTIRVCFTSPNFSAKTRYTMPDPVPANMEFRYYEFDELRALYQTADLLVLPLLANRYSAGLTTLLEAIACECPVIVANTPGVISQLIEGDFVVGYETQNVQALSKRIAELLNDPAAAAARARRARNELLQNYSTEAYLGGLRTVLLNFHPDGETGIDLSQPAP